MKLLPRFPGTVLVALALACLVWYATALERRERISERQVDAAVTLVNVPAEMVVTSEVPRTLTVRVRGPLRRLRALAQDETGVVIDLRGAGEGERVFPIESGNVVVPGGVQVIAVAPAEVPLRLERIVRRTLPVRVPLIGEPAEGFVAGTPRVEPATVVVSGPRLMLEALRSVVTDPVDVSGAQGPVEALATVRAPGALTRVEEPLAVRVRVEVGKPPALAGEASR